jgi:hypothetical protein
VACAVLLQVVPPPRKGDAVTAPIKPEDDYKTVRASQGSIDDNK